MYSLILSSKLPQAKIFKAWVTREVLPSIRKNGGYIAGQEKKTNEELLADAILVANRIIAEREEEIEELRPKADYYDKLVDYNLLTNFRNTAGDTFLTEREILRLQFLLRKNFRSEWHDVGRIAILEVKYAVAVIVNGKILDTSL